MDGVLKAFGAIFLIGTAASAESAIKSLDADNDGTLDMAEVETAAAKVFAALDTGMEGTLDARELAGRLDEADLKELDAITTARWIATNMRSPSQSEADDLDGNGTLDEHELDSDEGAALLNSYAELETGAPSRFKSS